MASMALFTAEFSSSYCYSEAVRAAGGAEGGASIESLTVLPWLIVESLILPIVPSSVMPGTYLMRSIPIIRIILRCSLGLAGWDNINVTSLLDLRHHRLQITDYK